MSLFQFALLYLGLHLGMPAGLASLVLQAQVIFTIGLAALVLGERATRRQVLGASVGMAGLAMVAVGRSTGAPVLPVLVTIGAALCWAIGNVLSRRARVASGLSLVVWSALVVPVPAFGLALLLDGPDAVGHALTHLTGAAVFATFYTAFGASLLGYAIWNKPAGPPIRPAPSCRTSCWCRWSGSPRPGSCRARCRTRSSSPAARSCWSGWAPRSCAAVRPAAIVPAPTG